MLLLRLRAWFINTHRIALDFPSCPSKWRIRRWGQPHGAIVRSAIQPPRPINVPTALQGDNIGITGIEWNNLPPRPGIGLLVRWGQPHGAIVRSAIQPSRSINVPTALEPQSSFTAAIHLPLRPRKRFSCLWREPHGALMRSAIQIPRPGPLSQAAQCDIVPVREDCTKTPPGKEDRYGTSSESFEHIPTLHSPFPLRLTVVGRTTYGATHTLAYPLSLDAA